MAKRNVKATIGLDHGSNDGLAEKARAIQSRPAVRVECPGAGDVIARPSYTIKVAATSGVAGVDVSIDQGDWMPCREALGFWWFDWNGFDKGEHELSARSRMGDGLTANAVPRLFSAD